MSSIRELKLFGCWMHLALIASYVNTLLPKPTAGVMVLLPGYFRCISGLRPFAAAMQIMALQAMLLKEILDVKSRGLYSGK